MPRKSRSAHADYRSFLYNNFPYEETHPDRLATLAHLHGLRTPPPERCRVLELGCGLGGNITGLAVALPGSEFVGVDLSPEQIAAGKADARAIGLRNLTLKALDIKKVGPELGRFDYILCHGIYSWVPAEVRAAIRRVCRENLSDNGVAYVSFNTYPGWHMRGMVRDMLRREAGDQKDAQERVRRARALLELLSTVPPGGAPSQEFVRAEVSLLQSLGDEYLFYEHLVDINEPQYFKDFVIDIVQDGLCYLTDAYFPAVYQGRFGPDTASAIDERSDDFIEREQLGDYIDTRFFRRALLCHAGAPIDRALTYERVLDLHVATDLAPTNDEMDLFSEELGEFHNASGRGVSATLPLLKAALLVLRDEAPGRVHVQALVRRARERLGLPGDGPPEDLGALAANILDLYALGYADLYTLPATFVTRAGERPRTTALVRHQAVEGRRGCTNLLQESVAVDNLDRSLLRRFDGAHDRAALIDGVLEDMAAERLRLTIEDQPVTDREVIGELVDQKLRHLAGFAFCL